MTLAALTQPNVTEAYITPQLDSEQVSRKAPALLLATDLTRTAVYKPEAKQTLQSQSHQLLSLALALGREFCLPVSALKQGIADLHSNTTRADAAIKGPYAALIISNAHRIVSGVLSVAMPDVIVAGKQVAALCFWCLFAVLQHWHYCCLDDLSIVQQLYSMYSTVHTCHIPYRVVKALNDTNAITLCISCLQAMFMQPLWKLSP